ncbi:MAG: hypothetical protein O3A93_06170 [Chloroflexi bacterium]|nr:hypothetical protein [Chloroflexota bacterium]MDA1270827.1 hypothetical protein [Chloroflexota bacterium]
MSEEHKDYNQIELETIAALRAEGHDSFSELMGPLRRRMAEKTGVPTRPTPWLVRFSVTLAALSFVGVWIIMKFAG